MIKIEMNKDKFIEMIKIMAIPTSSPKEPFLFPKIVLTLRPEGEIEWMGRLKYVTVWVRVEQKIITDISEPVQILIDASQFHKALNTFKRKTEIITFTHNPDHDDTLTAEIRKKKRNEQIGHVEYIEYTLRKANDPIVQGVLEELPFRLEKGTDIILFKNGSLRPNISGSCDISLFKNSIKPAELIDKWRKEKKKKQVFSKYNIFVDSKLHQIKIVEGNEHGKYSITDLLNNANVNGSGELHYTSGFAEVVSVLSGEIKFYAVDNGPLYIMQDINGMKARFLIAPTPVYTYRS